MRRGVQAAGSTSIRKEAPIVGREFAGITRGALSIFIGFTDAGTVATLGSNFILSVPVALINSVFLLVTGLPVANCASFVTQVFNDS